MTEAGVHARRTAIDEAVAAVRARTAAVPQLAILPGDGLRTLAAHIDVDATIGVDEIPHVPAARVDDAPAQLLLGKLAGRSVAVLTGRSQSYDGHTLQQVTFPVRVLRALGAHTLIVTGSCSAVHPLWAAGELMLIDDHINLIGDNPLIGPNLDELGPRFPDMSLAYDPHLKAATERVALKERIPLRRGIYAAVAGPNTGTRAECRMLRMLGADAVGTGIVADVIVARHMAMRVLGVTAITALCLPDAPASATMQERSQAADAAAPQLTRLLRGVLAAPEPEDSEESRGAARPE